MRTTMQPVAAVNALSRIREMAGSNLVPSLVIPKFPSFISVPADLPRSGKDRFRPNPRVQVAISFTYSYVRPLE
jgi:hypothetical protein